MSADSSIVEELRKRRHEISERLEHDRQADARHLKEIEHKYCDRVVSQVKAAAPRTEANNK